MDQVVLSIIVPTYNMEKYLDECLRSFAGVGGIEVIVVDDGSTDDSAKIAMQYTAREPEKYRLISKTNGGHGSAVNAGIEHAVGKYLRVVDADDMVNEDGLRRVVSKMHSLDADLIVDERVRFQDSGACTEDILPAAFDSMDALPEGALPFLNMHTLSVRRDFYLGTGLKLLEHTFYVDFQYAFVLLTTAKTVHILRERVYRYRIGNEGQSVFYLNYVKKYDDHDRVLKACISASPGTKMATRMLVLLVHTQLKIALIFDPDGRRGRRRGSALMDDLRRQCPAAHNGARKRYYEALLLNVTGLKRILIKKAFG